VIVAEDITSRFLNVISLFNGSIPLVAIQMSAVRLGDSVSLICLKVLDEVRLGLVDEDEEVQAVTDRSYWEARASKHTLAMADEMLEVVRALDPNLDFNARMKSTPTAIPSFPVRGGWMGYSRNASSRKWRRSHGFADSSANGKDRGVLSQMEGAMHVVIRLGGT
jgi:hypothetical protein